MSEICPKCGSPRTQFEGQTSWECGSYQSLIGGSHIKTPAFKLIESEHCLCRTALAAATKRAEEAEAEADLHRAVIEWTAKLDESEDRWAAAEKARDAYNDMRVIALEEVAGCRDRIKEYREKVEQLETDKANYHDKWLNALEKLKAAEQENARLRKALDMWRKGDVPGHPFGTLAAARTLTAALLAKPEGGPDA